MDKNRIWQIALLALLILAIVAILIFNNKLNATKDTLATTSAALTAEQENTASLQASLDEANAQNTELAASAEKLQGDLDAASEQLTASEAQVAQLEQTVAEREASIEAQQAAIEEKEAAIAELEETATAKDTAITGLIASTSEKNRAIQALETAVSEAAEEVTALQGSVAELENTIGERDAAAEAKTTEMEATIAGKDKDIADLNTAVSEQLATIDDLNAAVAESEAKVLDVQVALVANRLEAAPADIAQPVREQLDAILADDALAAPEKVQAIADIGTGLTEAVQAAELDEAAGQVRDMIEKLPEAADAGTTEAEIAAVIGDEELTLAGKKNALAAIETGLVTASIDQLTAQLAEHEATVSSLNDEIEALTTQGKADASEIERLHAEGRLFRIAPSRPVEVARVEKDVEKLGALYWHGYQDCLDLLDEMRSYLGAGDGPAPAANAAAGE